MSRFAALGLAAVLALPGAAAAHEVLHDVERGKGIAVKAYHAHGEVLAHTAYEIYSPADPETPYQEGLTDRNGWVAFVPDAPGSWRVRIIDHGGHGLDLLIDADAPSGEAPPAGTVSGFAFALRPLVGIAVLGAVFAALFITYRRKARSSPR